MAVFSSMLVWGGGCASRASALIAPDVAEAIHGAAEGELIPVILTFPPLAESGSTDGGMVAKRRWAEQTQRAVLELLEVRQREGRAARIRPLWITNSIAVHATASVIRELEARDDLVTITRDRPIALPERAPEKESP